ATNRGRSHSTGARAVDRPVERALAGRRPRELAGLLVLFRLVLVRRQRPRADDSGILRRRRSTGLSVVALERARRGGKRARRQPGPRPVPVAGGRDARTDHVWFPPEDGALDEPPDLPAGNHVR